MLVYHINLLLILGLAYPLCIRKPGKAKKLAYMLITFGYMLFLSAARYGIGFDYKAYLGYYDAIAATPWGELGGNPLEIGYVALNKLLAPMQLGPAAFYTLMAVLCLAPVAWFIYRYSPNVWLSAWLYSTLTFFYGTMNFIRQNIAVSILLLGFPLLRKRKLWATAGYAGVILLAATFHKTALILLPILLLCHLPLNRWIGLLYGGAGLFTFLFSDFIIDFLTGSVLPHIPFLAKYQVYRDSIYLSGLSPIFLWIPGLVLALMLCAKKRMEEGFGRDGTLMVNMMVYNAVIWLFIVKHMILERFSLYVYIYVLLAVPMAVEALKPDLLLKERCDTTKQKLKETREQGGSRSGAYKALNMDYTRMAETYRSQQVLWGFLVGAVLLATFIYNVFGMYDKNNGFHGVFPYQSLIGWLNQLP